MVPAGVVFLVVCVAAVCVCATYNGTCARELAWAPTPGRASDTLEVGWPDGVPAVLVLVNATSNQYVHYTGRYNKEKAAPGPVSQETHGCVPLGTNETLTVPNFDASARIRLDPATNDTLLEPLPGRDVVFANDRGSFPVLEWLANMTQGLALAEARVFGPGWAPEVTSEPPPAVSTGHPGTWGTDNQGAVVIEPLTGKTVLVAGVDVVLELHRITERIKNLKAAVAVCPCLARPTTCHPCGAARCTGTPRCNCMAGWRGSICDENLNECALGTHTCNATQATCTDSSGSFLCACNTGFTGNGIACDPFNECAAGAHNCNGTAASCTDTASSFSCACNLGYTGNGVACSNVNECTLRAHNCHLNAACTDTAGSFVCACNLGYTGNGTACSNVNECVTGAHSCNGRIAACVDTAGSFSCVCNPGYTGNGVACSNVNECTLRAHNCHLNAACTDTVGSFVCACNPGFTGNGTACSNVNECAAGAHSCNGTTAACVDTAGSFSCGCNPGYTGNGVACSNVNECTLRAHNCHLNATCTDTVGSFVCACTTGFVGNGAACSNVNECAAGGTHSCGANAACVDTAGSFSCACKPGFFGNGITCTLTTVTDTLQLIRQVGSTSGDFEGRVTVDDAGRVFVVGAAGGPVDGHAFAGGSFDVYLAAYNSSTGAQLWSQMVGSSSDEVSYGMAADGAGSVYVAGYTSAISLDGQARAGGADALLVRFNSSSGSRLWTRLLGATGDDFGRSIAVDRSNPDAIYLGGYTLSTSGTGLPGSAGGLGGPRDAFAARYASNGTRVWVSQFGTGAEDHCYHVTVFQSELYATGYTSGVMAGTVNAGNHDIFITRITALGVVAWTVQLGSPGGDQGLGIAVDGSGVYVTGLAGGRLNNQPPVGSGDVFLARYTHAGAWSWTRILGSGLDDMGRSVALDFSGNVLIAGYVGGALSGQSIGGVNDVFVASFTSSGVLQRTMLFGTSSNDIGYSVAVDRSSGAVFAGGRTEGSLPGQSSLGSSDLFLLKLQYACGAGLTGDGVICTNVNECATGAHNCNSSSATCSDMAGSFTCACNAGFTGTGVVCAPAIVPALQWARQTGSASSDREGCVAVDDEGRVFLAGQVGAAVDGLALVGGSSDGYLAAYNSSTGGKLWSQILGSAGTDVSYGVAADRAGSVYVTGSRSLDIFLARCAAGNGTVIWTVLLGAAGEDDVGFSVAVDRGNSDAIYVGGYTKSTNVSGLSGSAGGLGGSGDAFVARFARSGMRVWVTQLGSKGNDVCRSVTVFQSDLYATGYTSGVMAGTINVGSNDIFVARITAQGVVAWVAQLGSPSDDHGLGIAADGSGVYVTGRAKDTLDGQPFVGNDYNVFLARYTHAGVRVWTRMMGTRGDAGRSVTLDPSGSVLVTGYTGGALGGQTNAGDDDVFVASFTSSGVLLWLRLYGTVGNDTSNSVAVESSSGAVFVAGHTAGSMLGQSNQGSSDLLLLRLAST